MRCGPRVLVIGASGFIGSAVVTALRRANMEMRCVVRDQARFMRRFPDTDVRELDLIASPARDVDAWAALLGGIDAVVNVSGVLQPAKERESWAVHHLAPDVLFAACERTGVRRVIHVSAVGVAESDTTYARSKRAGERSLMDRDPDWTVLRPALVVGEDSYGGTSLLRALAAFPLVTPVIGDGMTPIDVIHKEELAQGIVRLLETGNGAKTVLEPAGEETLSLVEMIRAYQCWLGLRPRRIVRVPFRGRGTCALLDVPIPWRRPRRRQSLPCRGCSNRQGQPNRVGWLRPPATCSAWRRRPGDVGEMSVDPQRAEPLGIALSCWIARIVLRTWSCLQIAGSTIMRTGCLE